MEGSISLMDVTSYLLGKQAGGGGSSALQNKSVTITENGTTNVTADTGYDGLSKVEVTTNVSGGGDLSEYFRNTLKRGTASKSGLSSMVKTIPANTTCSYDLTYACSNTEISYLPVIDTSDIQYMDYLCKNCYSLVTFPLWDCSKVLSMNQAFYNCTSLENFPVLNISIVQSVNQIFYNCPKLTDASLNNILKMCIGATSYRGDKNLGALGFSSTNYPASRIQALPHYQDFINAGWVIGY